MSRHIFTEVTSINYYVNPSSGSRADTCGETDGNSLRECKCGNLGLHVWCTIFLAYFFTDTFSQKSPTSDFEYIQPVGAELIHSDGRASRRAEVTGAFRDYANAPTETSIGLTIGYDIE
jgi:hypothetical protein